MPGGRKKGGKRDTTRSSNDGRRSPTGNTFAPLRLDGRDPDNPAFKFLLVAPGNVPMTVCFAPKEILTGSFEVGGKDAPIHDVAKQNICNAVIEAVAHVIPIEDDVKEAFDVLVEATHLASSITKDSFSFGCPGSATRFTFPAVCKCKFRQEELDASDPTVVCHPPDVFIQQVCDVVSSALCDEPSDESLAPISPFLPPPIKAAFDAHVKLKSQGLSPVKSFTDSLALNGHGNWTSSITVFAAPDGATSGPRDSQFPPGSSTPPDAPAGQDMGPSDDTAAPNDAATDQTSDHPTDATAPDDQQLSAHQNDPGTTGNPAEVSDVTGSAHESDTTQLMGSPADASELPTDVNTSATPALVDRVADFVTPRMRSHLSAMDLDTRNRLSALRATAHEAELRMRASVAAVAATVNPNLTDPPTSPIRAHAQAVAQAHTVPPTG